MEYQEILVKEYIAYLESKDRFIERSFMINRFYMVLVLLLTIAMFWFAEQTSGFSPLVGACAIAGMIMSIMWVLNQDAYAYLIKIKLADVIEKMEQHLPIQPHVLEYEAIKAKQSKKRVMFVDVQKSIAFLSFIMFLVSFLFFCGFLFLPDLMKALGK